MAVILGFPHRKATPLRRRQIRQKVVSGDRPIRRLFDPGGQVPRGTANPAPNPINLGAVDPNKRSHALIGEALLGNPIGECHDDKGVSDTRVCQAQCAPGGLDDETVCAQDAQMAGKRAIKSELKVPNWAPKNLSLTQMKAWRKQRKLTQNQVAPIAGIERSQASRVENAKSPYSQRNLERLATFYECQPWQLLVQDPTDKSWAYKFLAEMSPKARNELVEAVKNSRK